MKLALDELTHLIKLANKNANESCVVTNNFKLSRSISKKAMNEYKRIKEEIKRDACEPKKSKRDLGYFLSRIHSIRETVTWFDELGCEGVTVKVVYPNPDECLLAELRYFLKENYKSRYIIQTYTEN